MPKIIKTKIKNSKTRKKYSTKTTYILSAVKGLIFALNGFFLVSFLLHKGNDFNLFYKIMIFLVIGLGGFISGFIAHSRVRGRAFLDGIIPSVIYISFLSFVMILLLKLNFSSHIIIIYPIAVISGFLGGIIKA